MSRASMQVSYPEEWQSLPLGTIASTQYGVSVATSNLGAVPIIGMRNLSNGIVDVSDTDRVDMSQKEVSQYALREGDLLFNRTNSKELVGKTAIFKNPGDAQFVFASYLIRIAVDRSMALPEYVCYFMNSAEAKRVLKSLATPGVSQYNINPLRLSKKLTIPIPPLEEQKAIVEIGKSWDRHVSQMVMLRDRKLEVRKALGRVLLTGGRRFPEFVNSSGTCKTRVGSFPEDWPCTRMGAIAKEIKEQAPPGSSITVLSCTKHEGLVDSLAFFGKQVFSDDTGGYKIVRQGQFAYATNHIEEGSIGLLTRRKEGLVSPMYTVFETSAQTHPPFLYALFKTELYRHIFQSNTNASVNRRGGLRWSQFAEIEVALPTVAEQMKIADFLSACDREIELLGREVQMLTEQKQKLLRDLLTGRIRVSRGSIGCEAIRGSNK